MWKYGIIDLHSYGDIKKRSKMLYDSMFNTEFTSARYMPTSRELSAGKRSMIKNWIKCGMRKTPPRATNHQCSIPTLKKGIEEVRRLLQHAVILELSTIPIYMTAWFSLKTEFGRNQEIADVLKTVFVEEMLHMALAVNVLNSIGGSVQLIDGTKLPLYPTILDTGHGYQILPDVEVALTPFSMGLVDQIFSRIESPSDHKTKQVTRQLGAIWKHLYAANASSIAKNMRKLLREVGMTNTTANTSHNAKQSIQEDWKSLIQNANRLIDGLTETDTKSVGGLYSAISLKLISLEACAKVTDNGTIFQGNESYQFNMSHWYQRSYDSIHNIMDSGEVLRSSTSTFGSLKGAKQTIAQPLFKVTDLKSALEAIVEIIYQGEGGSECSPFVPESGTYDSLWGRDHGHELSHYYRFREIVHGRRLSLTQYSNATNYDCIDKSTLSSCSTPANHRYCYSGDVIPFYRDGVWPIRINPKEADYVEGSRVRLLNKQFNLIYTRLLFCMEKSFTGRPNSMKECMTIMYDLTIAGKRLVQTPVLNHDNTRSEYTGTPTWQLIRDEWNRAGFTLIDTPPGSF